jgi:hypothetical protein
VIVDIKIAKISNHEYFKASIFFIYSLLSGYFLINHAMWRDELQLWLVASKSENLFELVANKQYEIRPYIWFLICWILSRFTQNPEVLKIFNYAVCISLAIVLLYRCKGSLVLRIGFLFGFLTLFGYSAISEEYLLGTLIFIIAVSQIQHQSRHLSVLLVAALLANINLTFAIVSIGIALIPSYSVLMNALNKRFAFLVDLAGIVLYISFFLFSIASMWPPSDFGFRSTSPEFSFLAVKKMAGNTSGALVPFVVGNSVNGQLGNLITYTVAMFAFAAILVLLLSAFKKSAAIGVSTSICMVLLVAWTGIGYANFWWHLGVVFIAYFGFSLISISEWKESERIQKVGQLILAIVLVSQSIALFIGPNLGVVPRMPYSMARESAAYVDSICGNECTVITNDSVTGASISAYLGGKEIFRADRNDFGTFVVWDSKHTYRKSVSWSDLISSASKFSNPIFVTSNMYYPPDGVTVLANFSGAVWANENFLVSRPNL